MNIKFNVLEYTSTGSFCPANYEFDGDIDSGWQIIRNQKKHLSLGPGYRLLKSRMCGICSTDLARRYLPFPLPQITGHEVVVEEMDNLEKSVVEINDTAFYRGEKSQDPFYQEKLYSHTPGRMVLGIDRLPGGFGPYLLAPKNSVIPLDQINDYAGVLIEPFAAAFHAISVSAPKQGDSVAVLGPRRLGTLLIAGLKAYRRASGVDFHISAVARYRNLLTLCHLLGSDTEIDLAVQNEKTLSNRFDIVYDTTGSESGFEVALQMAEKEVHLKSTSGQPVCGLNNLTPFVVDELSILSCTDENIHFSWSNDSRKNEKLYMTKGMQKKEFPNMDVYQLDSEEAFSRLYSSEFKNRLPRYDIAIASSLKDIDEIIRPNDSSAMSLIRPRGAILFKGEPGDNPLLSFISKGGVLRSSRCGDFRPALKVLHENPDITDMMSHHLVSHVFPSNEIEKAFQVAGDSKTRKVVVKHL